MKAIIKLKSEPNTMLVENLDSIKSHKSANHGGEIYTDFNSFFPYHNRCYSFIGTNTLAVSGADILYIKFEK